MIPERSGIHEIKKSLRSVNNCFGVPNLFINVKEQKLTQNIEFIPKHIRRKIIQKQNLNCKDIMQLEFRSQRPKVDVVTVKTAVKIQQKYRNIIQERDKKAMLRKIQQKQFSNLKENQLKVSMSENHIQPTNHNINQKKNSQCMKLQVPTQKQLKNKVIDGPELMQN